MASAWDAQELESLGGVPVLVSLFSHALPEVIESAAETLLEVISSTPLVSLKPVLDGSAFAAIARLLKHTKLNIANLAVSILLQLAEDDHFQGQMAEHGCLAVLAARLRQPSRVAVEATCSALTSLATHFKLKGRIGELNTIQPLLNKLKHADEGVPSLGCS